MPLVSVIMPVFNGELYLAEAIDSILSQTFTDFELIIVDDGSEDGSAEIIRAYEKRDGRIQFIQLDENVGTADARNSGLWRSNGKYVTMMDCDDVSLPERLAEQVAFLDSNPDIGAVGIQARAVNHDRSQDLFDLLVPSQHCLIVLDMFVRHGFVYATPMYRREQLMAVDGHEPKRRTAADRELLGRLLWETSIRYANVPKILMLYRRHRLSVGHNRDSKLLAEALNPQERMLKRLWKTVSNETLDRFFRMRGSQKLDFVERRYAKQDLIRLIDALIEHNWVEPGDRSIMMAAMRQHIEWASPRLWQKFCHWGRHHFGV